MGKLIDADKVQSWIDVEFEKKFPGDYYGYADGRQTILDKLEMEINNGTFDPDPIPLPTIKPGDKVTHSNLGNVRVMELPTVLVLKDDQEYEVYLSDLEVSHE